jgi:hypothetical protein
LQEDFLIGVQPVDAGGEDGLHGQAEYAKTQAVWTSVTVQSDRLRAPSSNKACTVSSMKNGVPSVVSMMSCFNGRRSIDVPQELPTAFIGTVRFERLKPQEMAAGLVSLQRSSYSGR